MAEGETPYYQDSGIKTEAEMPHDPLSSLWLTIDPAWGKEATKELYAELGSELGKLSLHSKDFRLANLSGPELVQAKHWFALASDCLDQKYKSACVCALTRGIQVLELSQSKQGFLRKRLGTRTREEVTHDNPSTKKMMGGGNNE
jgi:hypothetical protein